MSVTLSNKCRASSCVCLTRSDEGWAVFLCVPYTECQVLVCVIVCLLHRVKNDGLRFCVSFNE